MFDYICYWQHQIFSPEIKSSLPTPKLSLPLACTPQSLALCKAVTAPRLYIASHGCISLVPHLIGPPSHWFPISLVPHPIGPHLIGPPIHKSPTTLFELIGPPSHWSPFSLVHPFSANPNGPPFHWSPISLAPQSAPTHRPFHWSLISLVPHSIGPFSPAGPPIHKSPPHCLNSMAPFSLVPLVTLFTLFSLVPHLIGPPM